MKRSFLSLAIVVFCGLGALAVSPGDIAAQVPPGCGLCSDSYESGEWVHRFGSSGALFSCAGTSHGCHTGPTYDTCSALHSGCSATNYDAAGKAVQEFQRAIERGDAQALDQLLKKYKGNVVANVARASLDVKLCNGTLAARVPLPATLAKRLAV